MKTVLITGAGRGIGLALVKEFLANGDQVIGTYREDRAANELLRLAQENPQITTVKADVADEKSLGPLKELLKKHGTIDILVNNAGVIGESSASLLELDLNKALQTLNVNSLGPMRITKVALPFIKKGGVIAQITSLMGSIEDNGSGGYYDYRMSKAALNMFNKSLMHECPQLTCLVLHPGWVQTDMGGMNAPTSVKESAHGLFQLITGAKPRRSGEFRDFKGELLPW